MKWPVDLTGHKLQVYIHQNDLSVAVGIPLCAPLGLRPYSIPADLAPKRENNFQTAVPKEFHIPGLRSPCAYYVPDFVDAALAEECLHEFQATMDWKTNEKTMNRWTALYGEVEEYRYGRTNALRNSKEVDQEGSDLTLTLT